MSERYIYFIKPVGALGPIKIGISQRPQARLVELLEWCPLDLEIAHSMPGTYMLEHSIHGALADDHLRREWFKPTDRVVKLLADLQAGVPIEEAIDLTRKEGVIRRPRRTSRPTPRKRTILNGVGLTFGQLTCLRFIQSFEAEHGRVPTYQQIADGIGLHSRSGVHRYILALEERGRITRTPFVTGGFSVVRPLPTARAA
jgi:hypothetical protein